MYLALFAFTQACSVSEVEMLFYLMKWLPYFVLKNILSVFATWI